MKFAQRDLKLAMGRLGMCRFFPSGESERGSIEALLARICPHKEALEWLVDQFINRINDWQGPGELRGVLCTRYRPDDGVEANCSISGYRPEDGEARVFEQHAQLKAGGWTDEVVQNQLSKSSQKLIEGMKKDWPQ